ncbi:MAG: hypothetical protein WBP72_01710 [Rhodocyclaceae bacterium]|jgi:hypothetical protein
MIVRMAVMLVVVFAAVALFAIMFQGAFGTSGVVVAGMLGLAALVYAGDRLLGKRAKP